MEQGAQSHMVDISGTDRVTSPFAATSRLTLLLRSLSPGSFTRIAIEEAAGMGAVLSAEIPIVAFSAFSRGYRLEDLARERGVHITTVGGKTALSRLSKAIFGKIVPPHRDSESYLPVLEMMVWSVFGGQVGGVNYCEDQFVGLPALIRRALNGTPYVLFVAEVISSPPQSGDTGFFGRGARGVLFRWLLRRTESAILGHAAAIVFCSIRTRDELLRAFPDLRRVPSTVIYPGCNVVSSALPPCDGAERYVLCVSKWDLGRHPEFALDLARRVPVKVVLGGTWITQDAKVDFLRVVSACAGELSGSVEVRDQLDEIELASLYSGAWVYIHWNPEGFGMGALEAMARGIPVVCTESAGVGELVVNHENGFLIDGRSVSDFANAIENLLSNPELRSRLSNGALESARAVRWEVHNQRLLSYLNIAQGQTDQESRRK